MHIFLDDYRVPDDVTWMTIPNEDWTIVRNYAEFVSLVKSAIENEVDIDFIAFDHDLADAHYVGDFSNPDEKTGLHCAKTLFDICKDNDLPLPDFCVHSLNPVGKQAIEHYLNAAKEHLESDGA